MVVCKDFDKRKPLSSSRSKTRRRESRSQTEHKPVASLLPPTYIKSSGDRSYRMARASRTKGLELTQPRVSLRTRDKNIPMVQPCAGAWSLDGGVNEVGLRRRQASPSRRTGGGANMNHQRGRRPSSDTRRPFCQLKAGEGYLVFLMPPYSATPDNINIQPV